MKALSTTAFTCMAWLGLIGVSVAVTRVHAEDPFGGHRLFFTEAQRKDASLKGANASSDSLPNASASEPADASINSDTQRDASVEKRNDVIPAYPADTRQHRSSTDRDEGLAKNHHVYFTGLVTGMREARALVNGLPCEPVSSGNDQMSVQPVPIDCHGVRNDGVNLAVSIISGKLWVTDQEGRVHQLLPGEGL